MEIIIREEKQEDYQETRRINIEAFGQEDEANLVARLRDCDSRIISLVAEIEGKIVGHIMFSDVLAREGDKTQVGLGLAPMAVGVEYQGRGIGSQLVQIGLNKCRDLGVPYVVVLGHPNYYPRFGFTPSIRFGLSSEYKVPEEVFMVLPFEELTFQNGVVFYREEFQGL